MNRFFAYFRTLYRFQAQLGCRETAGLLLAILTVKSRMTPGRQAKKSLERWVLFQKISRDPKILAARFSRHECRLTYAEKSTGPQISMSLRIPSSDSSDSLVFEQIFLNREYQHVLNWFAGVRPDAPINRILDVGANIGCAALFFHCQFPSAKIFCLEPETSNHARLRLNLELTPTKKIECRQAAIWTAPCQLHCLHDFREGQEWAARFDVQNEAEAANGDSVPAFEVWHLMELAGFDHVDLFKMDVEGAEAALLRDPEFKRFLKQRTSRIAVEIHPEFISIEEAVEILKQLGFETQIVGEYLCGHNRNF
jgi:FkbM family methyltransferase